MAALRIIVAGGDECSRDGLISDLIRLLGLHERTDQAPPRLYSTADDADAIRFRSLATHA